MGEKEGMKNQDRIAKCTNAWFEKIEKNCCAERNVEILAQSENAVQYGQYGELVEVYIIYSLVCLVKDCDLTYNINGETLKESNLSRAVMAD